MMEASAQILETNITDINYNDEVLVNRFDTLLKKHFSLYLTTDADPEEKIREAGRFAKFHLPSDINEFFLTYLEAPLYWLCEIPLNKYLKDFYKFHLPKASGSNLYNSEKEAYSKWLLIKSESEKKYFASTLINLAERSGIKNNFLGLILNGVIFSYDSQMFNPQKAIELFEQSKMIINSIKINLVVKTELNYLIELFSAYAFIKLKKYEEAHERLINALSIKPNGIKAKFQLALVNISLGHLETSDFLIKEIFADEILKFEYAVKENNLTLLKFLMEHPVLANLKQYGEFSLLADNLDQYFELTIFSNEEIIKALKTKVDNMELLNVVRAYSEDINTKIMFIKNVLELLNNSNNIYLLN